jgi:hypothetical protein
MVYRTLTLSIAALWSAQATAADMNEVYVAPGGIYAPAAQVYVRPAPEYAPPVYGHPPVYPPPAYVPPPVYPAPAYVAPRRMYPVPAPVNAAPGYVAPPAYWTRSYGYAPALSYAVPIPRPPAIVPYGGGAPCAVNGGYGQLEYCD